VLWVYAGGMILKMERTTSHSATDVTFVATSTSYSISSKLGAVAIKSAAFVIKDSLATRIHRDHSFWANDDKAHPAPQACLLYRYTGA